MVRVSSAFISSRRERIIFRVLSASGCACKAAAWVDVLRVLGKTDLDNTAVARDHSFHCIAAAESLGGADYTMHVGLTFSIFQCPLSEVRCSSQRPCHTNFENKRGAGNLMFSGLALRFETPGDPLGGKSQHA